MRYKHKWALLFTIYANILANYLDVTFLLSVHLELISLLSVEPGNHSLAPDSSHALIEKLFNPPPLSLRKELK